ncbi:unnamed protein product, partial [Onchocerca flexuosa]|uniref:Protein FAR1-RELATED SEQUENCE n=1 Tax=Onchocerca flexuosa TaxID=387005 RepID=A0A183HYL9_9BILA
MVVLSLILIRSWPSELLIILEANELKRMLIGYGSKPGAFVKPSPTFPTFSTATLSPTYGPLPLFYPFFLPVKRSEKSDNQWLFFMNNCKQTFKKTKVCDQETKAIMMSIATLHGSVTSSMNSYDSSCEMKCFAEEKNQAPYGLPFGRMPSGPMDARSMSPTYAAFVMQQAAQTMSPTFEMYRNFPFGPASPSSLFQ